MTDPCEGCRHAWYGSEYMGGFHWDWDFACMRMDDLPEDWDGESPCPLHEPEGSP